ncbi:MAG TPA: ABC transporter permease [Opitutaceae bacterium]|nr:ABC transporter permease [Opitutaceae bacterium]
MRIIFTLVRKDYLLFFSDRADFIITFVTPVILIYIFGLVFGVSKGDGRTLGSPLTGVRLAVVNQSDAAVVAKIIEALKQDKTLQVVTTEKNEKDEEEPLTEEQVRKMIHDNKLRFAAIFPVDAVSDDSFDLKLQFIHNPINEIENATVTGILQKTVYSIAPNSFFESLPHRAAQYVGPQRAEQFYRDMANNVASTFGGDPEEVFQRLRSGNLDVIPEAAANAGRNGGGKGDVFSQLVNIESEQVAGKTVKNPMATRLVGGWAMMFLLFSVSASAKGLFEEKSEGIFLRLLSSPVRRTHILWSKYLYGMSLGLIQLLIMFVAGHFMYGIDIVSHFGNLVLACLAASTACIAFGMLLASVSSSPQVANGLATLLILIMSAIGGAWFPVSFMPEFIQKLSKLTLVYWAIEGFQQVLWAGAGLRELLPIFGILFGIAAVVNVFSVWRFQRGNIFE